MHSVNHATPKWLCASGRDIRGHRTRNKTLFFLWMFWSFSPCVSHVYTTPPIKWSSKTALEKSLDAQKAHAFTPQLAHKNRGFSVRSGLNWTAQRKHAIQPIKLVLRNIINKLRALSHWCLGLGCIKYLSARHKATPPQTSNICDGILNKWWYTFADAPSHTSI